MSEPRITAVAIRTEPSRASTAGVLQPLTSGLVRAGGWAVDTAQQFGSVVAVLLGPVVFSTYAFAFWSLAANLGWTDTFPYSAGPLSNWLVWLGIAILSHVAAGILRRRNLAER